MQCLFTFFFAMIIALTRKKKKNTNYFYAQWLQHDQKFLISCHLSEGH